MYCEVKVCLLLPEECMTREFNNSSIHQLFESAGRGIPDLDGHAIRVAERRLFWSKLAQQAAPKTLADVGIPTQTPEQIAEWSKVQPGDELAPPPPTSKTEQQLAQLTQQLSTRPTGAAHVQPVQPAKRPLAPATTSRPTQRQIPNIQLPEMIIGGPNDQSELNYTPGPGDHNYIGAGRNIRSLLKVADYLSKTTSINRVVAGLNVMFRNCFNRAQAQNPDLQGKVNLTLTIGTDGSVENVDANSTGNLGQAVECIKTSARTAKFDPPAGGVSTINIPVVFVRQASFRQGITKMAAGPSYEQVYASYQAKGGDEMRVGQKSTPDVTQGQYASLLSTGSYLPPNLPDTMAIEIRAAIQNGKAVGVTVLTNPANATFSSKIDTAVRQIQFTPASEKMDFTVTKFPPA